MQTEIQNPGMELPDEAGTDSIPSNDPAIHDETRRNAVEIINQTDYEDATKQLVRLYIRDNDAAAIKGMLDALKRLEANKAGLKVDVDLDGRIQAIQKIYDLLAIPEQT